MMDLNQNQDPLLFGNFVDDYYVRKMLYNKKFSGKTVRSFKKDKLKNEKNPFLKIDKDIETNNDLMIVPITEIDTSFDHPEHSEHFLNKKNLWRNVIDDLEQYAVSSESYNNYYLRTKVKTYKVPIIDYSTIQIETNGPKKYKNKNWVLIFGKYYDSDVIYHYIDSGFFRKKLKPLTSKILPIPIFHHDDSINSLPCKITTLNYKPLSTYAFINRHNCINYCKYDQKNYDGIVIKLNNVYNVTHIGIIGDGLKVDVYPEHHTYTHSKKYKKKNINSNRGHIYVLDNNHPLSWIIKFELYYKNIHTKKWILLGAFNGNTNSYTENIIELNRYFNTTGGLLTNFLKIVVKDYHNSSRFRVAVYGKTEQEKTDEIETITYTVSTIDNNNYNCDGCCCGYYRCRYIWDGLKHPSNTIKKKIYDEIIEKERDCLINDCLINDCYIDLD